MINVVRRLANLKFFESFSLLMNFYEYHRAILFTRRAINFPIDLLMSACLTLALINIVFN